MSARVTLCLSASLLLLAGSVLLSVQTPQLPINPPKQFGTSVTASFDGWYDSPDGSHNLLIGYYNRNTESELDIPIGPNNKFEPGEPDRGQPTHFLTRRRFGMFVITLPAETPKTRKIAWTLTANGVTTTVPMYLHLDYNLSPLKSTEESPDRTFNLPATLRFAANGPSFFGPGVTPEKAVQRAAIVGTPMPIEFFVDDDARYSTGGNGPLNNPQAPVNLTISKYRGPGDVKVAEARPKFQALKGGKPMEPYSGKAATTVTFSQPGEYLVHVTVNDYSGNGGGGSGCCWTNGMIRVTVTP
jgi:hypothetical protein